jgi:AcrR family transcriptional regulator
METLTVTEQLPSPRPDDRRYHHGHLRSVLIDLGTRALLENRFQQTSLRELADQAGVSHGAPYRHFKDREALIAAIYDVELTHWIHVAEAIDLKSDLSGKDRWFEFAGRLLAMAESQPERIELLLTGPTAIDSSTESRKGTLQKLLIRWSLTAGQNHPLDHVKTVWTYIAGSLKLSGTHWLGGDPSRSLRRGLDILFQ